MSGMTMDGRSRAGVAGLAGLALLLASCASGPNGDGDPDGPDGGPDGAQPTVTLSAESAAPGESVELTARGFPARADVDVGFGPVFSEFDVVDRTRVDAAGTLRTSVEVPGWAEPDRSYAFVVATPDRSVRDSDSLRIRTGDEEWRTVEGVLTDEGVECPALRGDDGTLYTLAGDLMGFEAGDRVRVEGTEPDASICMQGTTLEVRRIRPPSEPSITVSAERTGPGESVEVRASGFPPNETMQIGFGPPQSEYDVIAEAPADSRGRVRQDVTVPSWAEAGRSYVFVVTTPPGEPGTRTRAVSEPVTIR